MAFVMGNQQHSIAIHSHPSHPHTIEDVLFLIGWPRCFVRLDLNRKRDDIPVPIFAYCLGACISARAQPNAAYRPAMLGAR